MTNLVMLISWSDTSIVWEVMPTHLVSLHDLESIRTEWVIILIDEKIFCSLVVQRQIRISSNIDSFGIASELYLELVLNLFILNCIKTCNESILKLFKMNYFLTHLFIIASKLYWNWFECVSNGLVQKWSKKFTGNQFRYWLTDNWSIDL